MAQLTAAQLHEALTAALARLPESLDVKQGGHIADAAALELISIAEPSAPPRRRIDRSLLDANKLYAIPDDALNLFPALVQAAVGAFAKGPIAALPDLVAMLIRYRSLKVEITAEEAAVLRVLKQAKTEGVGPLSGAEVANRLQIQKLALAREVKDVLAGLLAKKTEKATLVQEANGRWAIGNV